MEKRIKDMRKLTVLQRQTEQLRRLMVQLPELCQDFFVDLETRTSILTRINYAYDLRIFFEYVHQSIEGFNNKVPREYSGDDLKRITAREISYYLEYLNLYKSPHSDTERMNENQGKKRKLVAVRTFFKFLHVNGYIENNVTAAVRIPKILEKPIVYLDMDEVAELLHLVQSGELLSDREKKFHEITRKRDVAMFALLLGTGIRVNECVSLNLRDINLKNSSFLVRRKGGKIMELYFNDQVRDAMMPYWEEREKMDVFPGHEDALFLSMQRKRITSRAVENLVSKYAKGLDTLAHVTPHKFRSTFGTALYRNTGDIYLVADVLGHKDVNVTKRHYASIDENRRRMAADAISLDLGISEDPLVTPPHQS